MTKGEPRRNTRFGITRVILSKFLHSSFLGFLFRLFRLILSIIGLIKVLVSRVLGLFGRLIQLLVRGTRVNGLDVPVYLRRLCLHLFNICLNGKIFPIWGLILRGLLVTLVNILRIRRVISGLIIVSYVTGRGLRLRGRVGRVLYARRGEYGQIITHGVRDTRTLLVRISVLIGLSFLIISRYLRIKGVGLSTISFRLGAHGFVIVTIRGVGGDTSVFLNNFGLHLSYLLVLSLNM